MHDDGMMCVFTKQKMQHVKTIFEHDDTRYPRNKLFHMTD